jgi:hypothetical protein
MTALGQAPAAHADDFSTLIGDISQISAIVNLSLRTDLPIWKAGR